VRSRGKVIQQMSDECLAAEHGGHDHQEKQRCPSRSPTVRLYPYRLYPRDEWTASTS